MGKYSLPWEKDYDLRTRNWQTRSALIEAERAGASEETLAAAWGYLLNAQVSDPTGWFPFPVEIRFDYEMMGKALEAIGADSELRRRSEAAASQDAAACGSDSVAAPLDLHLFGRAVEAQTRWTRLPSDPGGYCLEVEWEGKGDGGMSFPWAGNTVEYSPAFMENMVRTIPVSELKGRNIHLALPNGLIGLGNRHWLVRDNQRGCVAAGLDFASHTITFEVQKGREDRYAFHFYLLQNRDADQALS
jgi:hypothetical protein